MRATPSRPNSPRRNACSRIRPTRRPSRTAPAGTSGRASSLAKKEGHGAGRPDPRAQARPRRARRAGRRSQPHHPPGPFVAPAQAARQVLADRPGVRRARLALQWAGPKRFHRAALALADLPPIEGLILSHDHYDHLDVPTIEALKDRVQRYFVPLGVGARLQEHGRARRAHRGVRLVARAAMARRDAHGRACAALLGPHAVGPQQHAVGLVGHPERRRAHLLQRRLGLLSRLQADRRALGRASTSR